MSLSFVTNITFLRETPNAIYWVKLLSDSSLAGKICLHTLVLLLLQRPYSTLHHPLTPHQESLLLCSALWRRHTLPWRMSWDSLQAMELRDLLPTNSKNQKYLLWVPATWDQNLRQLSPFLTLAECTGPDLNASPSFSSRWERSDTQGLGCCRNRASDEHKV